MSLITFTPTNEITDFINYALKNGFFATKADLVRKSIEEYRDNLFVREILEASQDVKDGNFLTGDLREILSKFEHKK
jgi:Arc/MetJ-type ribon-helix-helix transcriptional regulator